MLPHELIELRTALISKNSPDSMRLWVLILFHIQLFLRSSEGCSFKFEVFVHGLMSVDRITKQVTAIGVKIKGKSDESYKLMMISRNEKLPELCLIRHVLPGSKYLLMNLNTFSLIALVVVSITRRVQYAVCQQLL